MTKKQNWDDILSKFDKPAPDADEAPAVPGKKPLKNAGKPEEKVDGFDISQLKSTTWSIGGVVREFYTIGELAKAVGRKAVTLRSWETKGWLPAPKYRTPKPSREQIPGKPAKGNRLYSREQVLYLVAAAEEFRLQDYTAADWDGFRRHMQKYPQD
jgi:hypothetical protein